MYYEKIDSFFINEVCIVLDLCDCNAISYYVVFQ